MEGGVFFLFSSFPLSLIIHPPSPNLIYSLLHSLSTLWLIFSLPLFFSLPLSLSPALGFHHQCSGPSKNRPVTMQAQLTASAHVAKIGCVFLQLNMGLKYRALFLVHVF